MATQLSKEDLKLYGPLANLIGVWEGQKGDDTAPGDDRGTEKNYFRERMEFEPIGLVQNHEQNLYGLRYKTMAWRLGEENSFHEEVGYWLWDAANKQVMRCFNVPRGMSLIAGGTVDANSKEFTLTAQLGSETYGICSNIFLDQEFKTIRFDVSVKVNGETMEYDEDTQIKIKNQDKIFHHIDKNVLTKVN